MKHGFTALFLAVSLAGPAGAASAQCIDTGRMRLSFDDPREELLRAAEVLGAVEGAPMFVRREQDERRICTDSSAVLRAWAPPRDSTLFDILAPSAKIVVHSAYPRERNNGGLVETVGLNAVVDAGIAARWRWFSAVLAPRFTLQENNHFDIIRSDQPTRTPWSNPYHRNIDMPTRFGDKGWNEVQWGGSRIQAEYGPMAAGFSTGNLWIGGAQVYPILMSNTAPGFPHGYIGTVRPIDAWVTDIEVNVFWGQLRESDFFDGDLENDSHMMNGFELALAPHFIPGFQVGFARVYHDTASIDEMAFGDFFSTVLETPLWTSGGNRPGNAIGVLFGRFVLPESGFEVYGEWSREDTPYNLEDAFREPDWTQAYAIGFQKLLDHEHSLSRFYGELIHLGEAAPVRGGKGFFSYYTHSAVTQGHTNRGQVLGAAIGPGSDAQLIGFDHFRRTSRTHVYVERTRYDDDTYYRTFSRRFGEARHDVELTFGLSHLQRFGMFEVELGANLSHRYDRQFLPLHSETAEILTETNFNPWLRFSWRPEMMEPLLP